MKKLSKHITLAALVVAVVMLVAGGPAVASNTGFKLNKLLDSTGAAAQQGNNWVSIPYFNPYTSVGDLCTQTGLEPLVVTVTDLDPVSGAFEQVTCGTATANTKQIVPGRALRIRVPRDGAGDTPASIIIVGSHNPSQNITVPAAGSGQIGNLWFSVPYHTTAVTADDLCSSSGLTPLSASLTFLNSATGGFNQVTCGTATAATVTLNLGQAVRVREPAGASFIPAHF
jgi:hypothetical protein